MPSASHRVLYTKTSRKLPPNPDKPHRYKDGTVHERIENRWTPTSVIKKRMTTGRLVERCYERASIEARVDPELSMLLAQAAMTIQDLEGSINRGFLNQDSED